MTTADAGSGIVRLPLDGPPLATGQDALDALGEAWGSDASTIVVLGDVATHTEASDAFRDYVRETNDKTRVHQ